MLTLSELRQARLAAQIAILWHSDNGGPEGGEHIAGFQRLIARIDEEMGEAADM
jgi:hypothetical protein